MDSCHPLTEAILSVCGLDLLLPNTLHRDKSNVRSTHRFADCLGIVSVVLVAVHIGLYELRRNEESIPLLVAVSRASFHSISGAGILSKIHSLIVSYWLCRKAHNRFEAALALSEMSSKETCSAVAASCTKIEYRFWEMTGL